MWPFSVGSHGYGDFRKLRKHYLAHAWVCEKFSGPAPHANMDAAHSCGNRLCVNPKHLSWKTRAANHADKRVHGTHIEGERHPDALLSTSDARYILNSQERGADVARYFGVHPNTVYALRKRRSWKHI